VERVDHSEQVRLDVVADRARVPVRDVDLGPGAGVEDGEVDRTEIAVYAPGDLEQPIPVANVARVCVDRAGSLGRGGHLLEQPGTAGGDGHRRSMGGKLTRERGADAARATGDPCNAAVD